MPIDPTTITAIAVATMGPARPRRWAFIAFVTSWSRGEAPACAGASVHCWLSASSSSQFVIVSAVLSHREEPDTNALSEVKTTFHETVLLVSTVTLEFVVDRVTDPGAATLKVNVSAARRIVPVQSPLS